jgi:hypothetical protein
MSYNGQRESESDLSSCAFTRDWREAPTSLSMDVPESITNQLEQEQLHVRASFLYLSTLPYSIWSDWLIDDPVKRLEAARWLGKQIEAVAKITRKQNV